ncbi:MAG: SDR family oxidoreductase [Propionibacteriaceae bacterium]|jgi:3-oxoacyl-[acyl-carrier protein] reductase|nr:SDR family oxidoreductase [Propionibacteriaceae bacterium]
MIAQTSLAGKTALVTGAAQGIGRGIAVELVAAGCRQLTIVDLADGPELRQTVTELEAQGAEVLFVSGDVSQTATVTQAVDQTVQRWGRIDIIVNNAGISKPTSFFETSDEQWDQVLRVNLRSVFLFMKYGGMAMRDQGGGAIVNMSSISGITGGSTGPDYGASKAGVIALTKFGARRLSEFGIRVNAVAPATINTEMIARNYASLSPEEKAKRLSNIPMGRMGETSEVGRLVAFLASDAASYVTGETVGVTGGRMSS